MAIFQTGHLNEHLWQSQPSSCSPRPHRIVCQGRWGLAGCVVFPAPRRCRMMRTITSPFAVCRLPELNWGSDSGSSSVVLAPAPGSFVTVRRGSVLCCRGDKSVLVLVLVPSSSSSSSSLWQTFLGNTFWQLRLVCRLLPTVCACLFGFHLCARSRNLCENCFLSTPLPPRKGPCLAGPWLAGLLLAVFKILWLVHFVNNLVSHSSCPDWCRLLTGASGQAPNGSCIIYVGKSLTAGVFCLRISARTPCECVWPGPLSGSGPRPK